MKKKILPFILVICLLMAPATAYALENWVVDTETEWSLGSMNGTYIENGELHVTPEGWGDTIFYDTTHYQTTALGQTELKQVELDLEYFDNLKFRYEATTGSHQDGTSIAPLPFAEFWINDLETSTKFGTYDTETSNDRTVVTAYYDVSSYTWTTKFEFWVEINGGGDSERVSNAGVDNIEIWDWQTGRWVDLNEWARPSKPGVLEVTGSVPSGERLSFLVSSGGEKKKVDITSSSASKDISDSFSDYTDDVEVQIDIYGQDSYIDSFTLKPEGYDAPPIAFLIRAMTLLLGFAVVGWKFRNIKSPTEGTTTGVYTMVFILMMVVMWIIAPSIEDIVAATLYSFG